MYIEKEQREQLKALSKEIFGVSSKYQKFLDGVLEPVMQEIEEEVPGENGAEPTKRLVKVPALLHGTKQFRVRYYTVEEVLQKLLDFKKQRDEMMIQHKMMQEEAKARSAQEEAIKKAQEEIGGSSI